MEEERWGWGEQWDISICSEYTQRGEENTKRIKRIK